MLILVFLKYFLLVYIMKTDYWNIKYLDVPTDFIFGFGTTINNNSRNSTSVDIGYSIPVRISKYYGYRRYWNFHCPTSKFTALGLEKTNKHNRTTINGIIYPVNSNITNFDNREDGYIRKNIPIHMIETLGWINLPKHHYRVWTYIPKEENLHYPNKYNPVLQSYIDVCLEGCLQFGEKFAIEFLQTTFGWSAFWLNDREIPRRPWIYLDNYKIIDQLLEKYPTKNNKYKHRLLDVEFSTHF